MSSTFSRRLFNAAALGSMGVGLGAAPYLVDRDGGFIGTAAAAPDAVWGDLDRLQPPPRLRDPLVVDDYSPYQVVKDGLTQAYVEGRGGDLLLQAHRPNGVPTPVDFTIQVSDFRRLHVRGLTVRLDDEAKIRGGYVTMSRHGQGELMSIARAPAAEEVFLEGIDGDMGDRCLNTDFISMHSLGSVGRPVRRIVVQNSRATGIGIADSDADNSDGHCDAIHFQGNLWVATIYVQNCYIQSGYQGLQMVLSTMQGQRRQFVAENTLSPQTLYDFQRVSVNNANRGAATCIAVEKRADRGGAPTLEHYPRLRFSDVHLAKHNKRGEPHVQTRWFLTPGNLYRNASASDGPPQWRGGLDLRGTWVRHYDPDQVPDFAPANHVGFAYRSPWPLRA